MAKIVNVLYAGVTLLTRQDTQNDKAAIAKALVQSTREYRL